MKSIVYLVNVDYFFLSHRLPLALEAQRRGYDVTVITTDTGRLKELNAYGIKTIHLSFERGLKRGVFDFLVVLKIMQLYKKIKPDVVHHITAKPHIYGTIAAGFFSRKTRVVNSITGLGYIYAHDNRLFLRTITRILFKLTRLIRPRKTVYIFQNTDDLQIFLDYGLSNGVNSIIIPGAGVDENLFKRTVKQPLESDKIRVVFPARMLKDKGVMEFIGAAKCLEGEFRNRVCFLLVGGIDETNPAHISKDELLGHLIDDYLNWLGHQHDMVSILDKADIVCLPSYREGFPKALIEAMSMECAIVTTDVPGCRSCVVNGINGFLVPPRDVDSLVKALRTLFENDDLRKKMGKASRIIMQKDLTLSKVVRSTLNLYDIP